MTSFCNFSINVFCFALQVVVPMFSVALMLIVGKFTYENQLSIDAKTFVSGDKIPKSDIELIDYLYHA
jgi:hypothetical protein